MARGKTTTKTAKQPLPPTSSLQNKAYGKAMSRLREEHREEFDALVAEEYEAVGLTFRKRASAEEREAREAAEREAKAKAKLDKLLAEHPELRAHLNGSATQEDEQQ
jgi:dsDNA-binding SOS-regulon protein